MLFMNYFFVRSFGQYVMGVPRKFHKIIIIRATSGFVGIAGIFYAIKFLPVATANCLIMTNPIWVAIFSFMVLGEKLSPLDLVSIGLAFLGVFLVCDPFNWNGLETEEVNQTDKIIGVTCCLVASVAGAVSFVCMRIMKDDIHFSVSPFWYSIGGTFFSPIGAVFIDMPSH